MSVDVSKRSLDVRGLADAPILFRKNEIAQLLGAMDTGICSFVYGPTGAGKTSVAKSAMDKFNAGKNKAIYVNCAICYTENAVLRELISGYNRLFPSRIINPTYASNYDLFNRLKELKAKNANTSVVCLDHVDKLEEKQAMTRLLELGLCLIAISNKPETLFSFSPEVRASMVNTLQLRAYTLEETVRILKAKADIAIGPSKVQNKVLDRLAELCKGDIRLGLSLLLASAVKAVSLGRDNLVESDVPELDLTTELQEDDKILLQILKEQGKLPSRVLFETYRQRTQFPKAERTLRYRMQVLSEKNLVRSVGRSKDRLYQLVQQHASFAH